MNRYLMLLLAWLPVLLTGCRSLPEENGQKAFVQAVQAVREDRSSCLLVSSGRILEQRQGRGLSPLLNLYDSRRASFAGGMIADKVIGRAAAFILIQGKVVRVYGRLMCEDAKRMLEEKGIRVEYDLLVPRILNRQRDGLCPLEQSVQGMTDTDRAMSAIRQRLQELQKRP